MSARTSTPEPSSTGGPPHFRFYDPFGKDRRDLVYKHIGFTKRITWNYQYFVISVIALYAVIYQATKLYKRLKRPRATDYHISHSLYKWWRVWLISSPQNSLLKSMFVTNSNLLIISIFYAINLFVFLYNLPFDDCFNFALRSGLVAGSNLPLLYLIPLKNGPLLYLLNQSYENIIVFHKFIGTFVLGMSGVHMLGFVYTLNWEYSWIDHRSVSGFHSMFWFILIASTSFGFMRTRCYEFFKFVHNLSFFMFLPVFYTHHYVCKPFVIIIALCLAGDRLITWWYKLWCFQCTVETDLKNELMLIKIDTDISQLSLSQKFFSYSLFKFNNTKFNYNLSNHLFITIPQISLLQSHPFTIASSPLSEDSHLLLIVKIHKGFTSKLSEYSLHHSNLSLTCFINGPYGNSFEHLPSIGEEDYNNTKVLGFSYSDANEQEPLIKMKSLKHYSISSITSLNRSMEKIILIAGGAGISLIYPMLSHYQDHTRFDVSFFWILRNEQDIVTFDAQHNVKIWHTSTSGRPRVTDMLTDALSNNSYGEIHIIGCGPSGLMNDTKKFAASQISQNQKVNLVLEEFSF